MLYEIKFMGGDSIDITEEIANKLLGKTGLVAITGIGIINLNSVMYVLPKNVVVSKNDDKAVKCHDGSIAVKKFGKWVDKYSGADMSLEFYPELLSYKQEDKKMLN
jgi:hypothetical protein